MTFGPRHHSSPRSPGDSSSPVSGSTTIASMFGTSGPTEPTSNSSQSSGMEWLAGLISVMP